MKRTAQSTFEYVMVIAVIAAALAVMSVYTKRALQGRIRTGVDQISSESAYMSRSTFGTSTITRKITEDSSTYVDKTGGRRDSISDTNVTIEQNTTRDERASVTAGGG